MSAIAAVSAGAVTLHGAAAFTRPLSTDRPDATESPATVEAGRWQIETEPVRWGRDSEGGVRVETLVIGATNLKYGLSRNADLQIIVEPFVQTRLEAGGTAETFDGFGDTTVRLKVNLSGNDEPGFATAVMPFVKLPTASDAVGNGDVEGGVIVPFAFDLANGWGAGLMGEVDVVRDEADDGHEAAFIATATMAGDIAPGIGVFFELANEARESRTSTWALSFNSGITLAHSEDRQLDFGINLGLTEEAEDFAVFFGYSSRW